MSGYSVVYNSRDNTIDMQLTENGTIVHLGFAVRMVLVLGSVTVDSQTHPEAFDWTKDPYTLVLSLGGLGLDEKGYNAKLVVYTVDMPHGIVWSDRIPIKVVPG